MAIVHVNGVETEVGELPQNLVQAAAKAGVEVPHYCWHPALSVVASCRMCLVEVGEKKPDGTVAMQPKLLPACQTPARDQTVVVTNSEKVRAAQRATLEYLLLNHPLDCPTCDQAGECLLQDYSYRFGNAETRLREPKIQKADKPHIGEQITLFTDRCIMCTRCVRFTREISGTAELQVIHRGAHAEIDVFPGEPCNNKLAGNVVDICPVGALCSKDFLYKQRVWWLKSFPSVCTGCSTGCSIHVDQNESTIYRLRPRPNPKAQGYFMCDEGRFGFKYVHSKDRLAQPLLRGGEELSPVSWDAALDSVRRRLEDWGSRRPEALAAVLSPWMTCEEAYLLGRYLKNLSQRTRLFLGPVPVVGEDDSYPKDVHGRPVEPVRFTIRAEKCPNRRGVEAVLGALEDEPGDFEDFLAAAAGGRIAAAYVVGGSPEPLLTPQQARVCESLEYLVVQDIFPSPLSEAADAVLAGGSFAERDGVYVNHAGLAQAVQRAIHSPGDARPDGRILWDLVGRRGLFHAPSVRQEMARELDGFSAFAGDLGAEGAFLTARAPAAAGSQ